MCAASGLYPQKEAPCSLLPILALPNSRLFRPCGQGKNLRGWQSNKVEGTWALDDPMEEHSLPATCPAAQTFM